ncbi:MAG: hypothetical protein HRU23_18970 [Gammaproteobacteria bacterium]|nr:hypothetical protein [Gammaproteobacteria bacterium]
MSIIQPTIRVFPNKLDSALFEIHHGEAGETLHQWLVANVRAYNVREVPLFSAVLNGRLLPPEQWQSYQLASGDELALTVEAKGGAILYAIVAVVAVGAAIYMSNQIPDNYNNTTPDGSTIYDANAQGNRPRLMGIIPELAGRHKIFPDLLSQPRRQFINNEQWQFLMVAVGVGDHQINANEIFIGETPVDRYAGDIDYQIFSPGENVTGHEAHRNVYTSAEVGSTSGTSGLEIKGLTSQIGAGSFWTFSGNSATRLKYFTWNNGRKEEYYETYSELREVKLPSDWSAGNFVTFSDTPRINVDYEIEFLSLGAFQPNELTCSDPSFELEVGDVFSILGTTFDSTIELECYEIISGGVTTYLCRDNITKSENVWPYAMAPNLPTIRRQTSNDGAYRIVSVSRGKLSLQKTDEHVDEISWSVFHAQSRASCVATMGSSGDGLFVGPFFACPANEVTDTLWLDFSLPQGLGKLKDDGTFGPRGVNLSIQYRPEGGGAWITVPYSFSDSTNDQLGETMKINLGSAIRPEVQVRRDSLAVDSTRIYDKVEWIRLKSELKSAVSYEGVTTIAIKIRGTNSLASGAENKFNIISTRKLPVYENGAWSAPVATTDIAPFFAHVIKDVGHGDGQIGLTELERLHVIWAGRNDDFSAVFDNDSTLFNSLKRILGPGFAVPTLDYGQIIPVRDEPRTGFDYMYSPDNMKTPLSRNIKLFDPDEPDGVEVEFFSAITWKPETILCLLPGDLGIRPKKVRAFGITDRTKAWQFGMRKRREIRYRRTKYSFSTEMDALNSSYLSYDALADDIPGYSQTGRVTAVNGRTLLLNQSLDWGTGSHYISLRKPDGTLSGPYICTVGSSDDRVELNTNLDFVPDCSGRMEPPLFQFGEAERWCLPSLITDIKPQGTDRVSVTAVNYDERVYADDDNIPPA